MNLSPALGRWQYLRGKSQWYLETLRAWITPAAAAGAYAKYIGVSSRWSVVIAVGVPILVETFGFFLGRFLYDKGGVEQEYQMALDRDPYKRKSLEQLEAIRDINERTMNALELWAVRRDYR